MRHTCEQGPPSTPSLDATYQTSASRKSFSVRNVGRCCRKNSTSVRRGAVLEGTPGSAKFERTSRPKTRWRYPTKSQKPLRIKDCGAVVMVLVRTAGSLEREV